MEKGRVWKSIKPTFDLHTCTHMHAYALAHAHSHTNTCVYTNRYTHISHVCSCTHMNTCVCMNRPLLLIHLN